MCGFEEALQIRTNLIKFFEMTKLKRYFQPLPLFQLGLNDEFEIAVGIETITVCDSGREIGDIKRTIFRVRP